MTAPITPARADTTSTQTTVVDKANRTHTTQLVFAHTEHENRAGDKAYFAVVVVVGYYPGGSGESQHYGGSVFFQEVDAEGQLGQQATMPFNRFPLQDTKLHLATFRYSEKDLRRVANLFESFALAPDVFEHLADWTAAYMEAYRAQKGSPRAW